MGDDILLSLGQFGAAGLIGALWLLERRHGAARDRQLDEAHRRVMERERDAAALMSVVQENTRAIAALESSQRLLIDLLRGLGPGPDAAGAGGR
jgi:hypothetical protein